LGHLRGGWRGRTFASASLLASCPARIALHQLPAFACFCIPTPRHLLQTGTVVEYNPVTGALLSTTGIVADPDMQLTLATTFDPSTGTLYSNAIRASEGSNLTDYFLVSYNVNSGAVKALGPLPPAPGSAGPSGFREDAAISSLIVQTPSNGTQVSIQQ